MPIIPQFFFLSRDGNFSLIASNKLDELIMSGTSERVSDFIHNINARFELGVIKSGPGLLKF